MTLREAARELGVDPSTLRHQIANGSLEAEKHGRDWWVTPAALARYREHYLGRRGKAPRSRGRSRSRTVGVTTHAPARDLLIIEAIRSGRQGAEVAREHGLTRQRVSQIWLRAVTEGDPELGTR